VTPPRAERSLTEPASSPPRPRPKEKLASHTRRTYSVGVALHQQWIRRHSLTLISHVPLPQVLDALAMTAALYLACAVWIRPMGCRQVARDKLPSTVLKVRSWARLMRPRVGSCEFPSSMSKARFNAAAIFRARFLCRPPADGVLW
jgi:hypothetical protein